MDKKGYLKKGVRRSLIPIIPALLILFTILNLACTAPPESPQLTPEVTPPSSSPPLSPPSSPSPPQPQPSEPPSPVDWSADGIISTGEYTKNKTYDDFSMHWKSDKEFIYIAMKAKTNGWVAISLQPGQKMKDADMVFGLVIDGEAMVYDHFSTGNFGPHSADSELGGIDDISEFAGEEVDGFTTIEFKRKLDTGDKYDHSFSEGVNKIIWAWGTEDKQSLKHSQRGYGEIDI
ncbi:DOMON domain-containing protein [Chloroflexota bacterium]